MRSMVRLSDRFNPRSPCGERPHIVALRNRAECFNPRSPCGERQTLVIGADGSYKFQPTLPLRGATGVGQKLVGGEHVSTHAPLAGSDLGEDGMALAEGVFQPTLPLRGATSDGPRTGPCTARFNPRSPCGERLLHLVNVALRAYHMHDVFHPNASSDELRPSETNQKAVRTSQGIPDSPQFAPPIIPTAYS